MREKIGLFFWWISNEATVSISSATNVINNIDTKKYELILIYRHTDNFFYNIKNISDIKTISSKNRISIEDFKKKFDIALLMTHGKRWEDWVIQSIFELQKIPYCGCRVLWSSLCMDKVVMKSLLKWLNIPQTKFFVIDTILDDKNNIQKIINKASKILKLPIYVKPSNSGSSVWITKVESYEKLSNAVEIAAKHDNKIVIEQGLLSPREIEVAVLWNNSLIMSDPGELIINKEFYSYDDKYKKNKTQINIPASITVLQKNKIKTLAKKVYQILDCRWFARIDFFMVKDKIYLNEINTLPWFTNSSMFPMLIQNSGISYKDLITKIIELAY